jgi:2'-5' RNA ligase
VTADAAPARRLFFALWPTEAERSVLERDVGPVAALAGGRPVPAANLHVTLVFLGCVPDAQLAVLRAVGDAQPWRATTLAFDRLDWWARAAASVLGVGAPPAALVEYQVRMQQALAERGLKPDARPYRPHMTIARKVRAAPAAGEPPALRWRPSQVALCESVPDPAGSRYVPLAVWPGGDR